MRAPRSLPAFCRAIGVRLKRERDLDERERAERVHGPARGGVIVPDRTVWTGRNMVWCEVLHEAMHLYLLIGSNIATQPPEEWLLMPVERAVARALTRGSGARYASVYGEDATAHPTWAPAIARAQRVGVLDAGGSPTWQLPDWRALTCEDLADLRGVGTVTGPPTFVEAWSAACDALEAASASLAGHPIDRGQPVYDVLHRHRTAGALGEAAGRLRELAAARAKRHLPVGWRP